MHVERYYEDFSDPEAVSGSSTNRFLMAFFEAIFYVFK